MPGLVAYAVITLFLLQYINDRRFDKRFMLDGKVPAPSNLVDYAFPHFCGIYFASTLYFMLYCAFKRNKPEVHAEICLPGAFVIVCACLRAHAHMRSTAWCYSVFKMLCDVLLRDIR